MTVNNLIGRLATRAKQLADMSLPNLRYNYPDVEEASQVRSATRGLSRGQLVEAILVEEFSLEFDQEIET